MNTNKSGIVRSRNIYCDRSRIAVDYLESQILVEDGIIDINLNMINKAYKGKRVERKEVAEKLTSAFVPTMFDIVISKSWSVGVYLKMSTELC